MIGREPATGTCSWLRLFDPKGERVPLHRETAERERQRAEDLAQRLQEMGIDPDEVLGSEP